ncbi:hypothetical protein TNCV_2730281 [Trichonephila clavipes]|nr:hypothetical protein TNCV_2730281 [Trichonephila clavipes]
MSHKQRVLILAFYSFEHVLVPLNQHGRYLLGNKTAELIKGNLGYNFLPVEILNAVQTRSQVKAAREERGIDSGDAKKREDEVIIVSSDAEHEILILALQKFVRN